MKKFRNDQTGFGGVEALLVLIFLAIVGFAGYYVWHAQKTSKTTVTNSTKQSAKPNDPYAGWATYSSAYQNVSFKYPTTWTSKVAQGEDQQDFPGSKVVTLTGPSGFRLTYEEDVVGLGGACDPAQDPHVFLDSIKPANIPNSTKPIYLLESGDTIGLADFIGDPAPNTGDTGMCLMYMVISGNKVAGTTQPPFIEFGSSSVQVHAGTPTPVPASQQSDYNTAKLILKSLTYN